jgi:hypothetical protein
MGNARVKKLAIAVLLVVSASACRRQTVVTSVPTATPPAAAANAPGAATAREALTKLLAAAKVQDVQAFSNVWGTKEAGPVRTDRRFMTVEEMEQRIIYMIRCLRHDSWSVKAETPVLNSQRQFTVELRLRNLTAQADFTATPGPEARWYIANFDTPKLGTICSASG